jgi:MFS transporter, DHA2 family, multidrug resistance protein
MIAFAFLMLGTSMLWISHRFDLSVDFRTLVLARALQASGFAFLFIPINMTAYAYLAREKNSAASGLINLARNRGGSVRTSFFTTLLARRAQFHQAVLATDATLLSSKSRKAVQGTRHALSSAGNITAQHQAYGQIYGMILPQPKMLVHADNFWILAGMFFNETAP